MKKKFSKPCFLQQGKGRITAFLCSSLLGVFKIHICSNIVGYCGKQQSWGRKVTLQHSNFDKVGNLFTIKKYISIQQLPEQTNAAACKNQAADATRAVLSSLHFSIVI